MLARMLLIELVMPVGMLALEVAVKPPMLATAEALCMRLRVQRVELVVLIGMLVVEVFMLALMLVVALGAVR